MLGRAVQFGLDALSKEGVSITYTRGSYSVTIAKAAKSSSKYFVEKAGQTYIETTDADFVFAASLLILNGQAVKPARGDKIALDLGNGTIENYEAFNTQKNKCYRETFGAMRVCTKLVGYSVIGSGETEGGD